MGIAEVLSAYGDRYWDALQLTWYLTAVSFLLGALALGLAVTVMRVCPIGPLRVLGDFFVQVFRNVPGAALLILVVYGLPRLGRQFTFDYQTCVLASITLIAAAFGSENFMSGINAVGKGQVEAARSLGMGFWKMMWKVVIPQALRMVVLPMTNLLIAVMLTTSLAALVPRVTELTAMVSQLNSATVSVGITAFVVSALGYLATAVAVGLLGNLLDRKVRLAR